MAIPSQPVSIAGRQEVIITFLEPINTKTAVNSSAIVTDGIDETQITKLKCVQEKQKILNSLIGLIPGDIDENAIKAQRLARQ